MIGRHQCKEARSTGLKEAIAIGLDEALTALEESIHDLNDEQVRAFPIRDRNNIAWIVMHALHNLDHYAGYAQTAKCVMGSQDPRWDWQCPRPTPDQSFPSQRELMDKLRAVRAHAMSGIEGTPPDALLRPREHVRNQERLPSDAYMRTICHTMAHVRQIWLLRGALGAYGAEAWPRQHWA